MEQKQLDEIDDSYFGEEFIDDESFEEIVVERVNAPLKKEKKMEDKKTMRTRMTKNTGFVDAEKESPMELTQKNERMEPAPVSASVSPKLSLKKEKSVKSEVKAAEKVEAKEVKETKTPIETAPSVNPWADEEKKGSNFFRETSTWKAITGVILVLFVFSIFTQGFHFSPTSAAVAEGLSLSDAESKVLSYVNGNLLQPPYVAELKDSAEVNGLYRVSLIVADQAIDSYITKDGKLFFPQGLDTSLSLEELESVDTPAETSDVPVEITTETPETEVVEPEQQEPVEEQQAEPAPVQGTQTDVQHATLIAKRWLFSPQKLFVKKGTIVLTIEPQDVEFTFAIPALGVEQRVEGVTTVTLDVKEVGTYDFTCSSCEEWRGMKGSIVVK